MPGAEFTFTFEPGPGWTLPAVIQAAQDAPVRFLPEIVPRLVKYAQQNIEVGGYPESFDSAGRDRSYGPLARSTIQDKMRMGATYMKPGKRTGTNQASIHGTSDGDSVTIIADATHAGQQRAARGALKGLVGGSMRELLDIAQVSGMKRISTRALIVGPISRGWTAMFGPLKPVTELDVGGWTRRLMKSTTRGMSQMRQSYSAAVDALYPFMRFHKGLINSTFYEYVDKAAGQAATGASG